MDAWRFGDPRWFFHLDVDVGRFIFSADALRSGDPSWRFETIWAKLAALCAKAPLHKRRL